MHLGDAAVNRVKVSVNQFQVDSVDVFFWVHLAGNGSDVFVIKSPNHVHDGIGLADVFQELVSKAFTLRSPLNQTGDVRKFKSSVDNLLSWDQFLDPGQALVRHFDHAHVRFDGGKWVISHFRPRLGNSIK